MQSGAARVNVRAHFGDPRRQLRRRQIRAIGKRALPDRTGLRKRGLRLKALHELRRAAREGAGSDRLQTVRQLHAGHFRAPERFRSDALQADRRLPQLKLRL